MRDRSWRRYTEERIVLKRIRKLNYRVFWYVFIDINGIKHRNPSMNSFIGSNDAFMYKTGANDRYRHHGKRKYSPNRSKGYYDGRDNNTREHNKRILINIIKENGLK